MDFKVRGVGSQGNRVVFFSERDFGEMGKHESYFRSLDNEFRSFSIPRRIRDLTVPKDKLKVSEISW